MPPSLRRFSSDFTIPATTPTGRASDSPSPPPQASSSGHDRHASPHTETSPYAALGICVHEVNSAYFSSLLFLCPPSLLVLLLPFSLSYSPTATQPHSHRHTATQPRRHTATPPRSNTAAYSTRQTSAHCTCPLSYLFLSSLCLLPRFASCLSHLLCLLAVHHSLYLRVHCVSSPLYLVVH
jgi:hypothetical protein